MGQRYIQKELLKLIERSNKKLFEYPNDLELESFNRHLINKQDTVITKIKLKQTKKLYQKIQSRLTQQKIQLKKK